MLKGDKYMSRILRNMLIAILMVVILWLIFVLIDCIRLKNSPDYTYPLINLKQDVTKDDVTYIGLGYTIKYIQEKDIQYTPGSDASLTAIGASGAEFRLFGKILIWAYIE